MYDVLYRPIHHVVKLIDGFVYELCSRGDVSSS